MKHFPCYQPLPYICACHSELENDKQNLPAAILIIDISGEVIAVRRKKCSGASSRPSQRRFVVGRVKDHVKGPAEVCEAFWH